MQADSSTQASVLPQGCTNFKLRAGRDKRAEAQRHWKAAQLALNETLGVERVLALHALVDDSLDLLAALPAQEAGHDE